MLSFPERCFAMADKVAVDLAVGWADPTEQFVRHSRGENKSRSLCPVVWDIFEPYRTRCLEVRLR